MTTAELAVQCLRDTETVPAHHSMHCIEAARMVFPAYNTENLDDTLLRYCTDRDTDACRDYGNSLIHYQGVYWRAMAQSVASFGLPEDISSYDSGTELYFYADRMMPHFAACLEAHLDPVRPPPASSAPLRKDNVPDSVIGKEAFDNRHCIALGTNKLRMLP